MVRISTTLEARVLHHHPKIGLTTLFFGNFEMRVPKVDAEPGTGVAIEIDARDVSIALSRPMDVSITNRLPGVIIEVELLDAPYARVTFDLGGRILHSLVTWESVERLALEPGLKAWAMIKTVAVAQKNISVERVPEPRPPLERKTPRETT
jgi:molybdate transport system ATP-binding protein